MTQVIRTSYGAQARYALRAAVAAAKTADAMAPVTVLAPNNIAGIAARRHLASGIDGKLGIAGIEVTTAARLAERLAAPHLAPRRPITTALLAAAWRHALATDPGIFAGIAEHPATVRALAAAHEELRDTSCEVRREVAAANPVTRHVIALHGAVAARLQADWYDRADVFRTAADAARVDGEIVWYLPQALAPAEAAFISALGATSNLTIIAAFTGVQRADEAVHRTLDALGIQQSAKVNIPAATHVLNASDSDDEVRCVARDLMQTLQDTPAHRIAILYASPTPYARLLHDHLTTAGIRFNGPGNRPIAERAIPRSLLEVLALSDRHVPRAELFRALAGATLRDFDGNRIPVSRWERVSRSAGVVSGDDWNLRLDTYVADQTRDLNTERESDDPQDWLIERIEATVRTAQELQSFAARLRSELQSAENMTTWAELATWCRNLIHTLVGNLDELRHLPPVEQFAVAPLLSLLDGLESMDAIEPSASIRLLREVIEAELGASTPRVGRFGEGVFVGPVSAAIGLDLDVVYVLGVSEDIYPGRLSADALLPDTARMKANGELRLSRDRLNDKYRHLLAAFAAGSRRSVASFPRGDLRRSTRRIPSRWLLPTLRTLARDNALAATEWDTGTYGDAVTTAGSFGGQLLQTTSLATEQEWRTRTAAVGYVLDDEVARAAAALVDARQNADFSRFDGNLSEVDGLPHYGRSGRPISPTALEKYAGCPHAFFVERLLRVQPIEQPEAIISITPWDIGNLIHESLDELVGACGADLPGYGAPWSAEQRERLRQIAYARADAFSQRGLTGHPRLWAHERNRIMRDIDLMLDADDQWRAEVHSKVLASEMPFGMDGEPPVAVAIPAGEVVMRGSADKVDVGEDGTIYVTDVKTGRRDGFKGITQASPIPGGAKLQLPVYAYAARARFGDANTPVAANYWFVRKDPGRIGIELTPEVEEQYRHTLDVLVRSIASGLFPARPPETDDFIFVQCDYCNPDGIGYGDNRDRWALKRSDASLSELLDLVEPKGGT